MSLKCQLMNDLIKNESSRKDFYVKIFINVVMRVFKLDHKPNKDYIVYEWQIDSHDIYSIDESGRKSGVFVKLDMLHNVIAVKAYRNGIYLFNAVHIE